MGNVDDDGIGSGIGQHPGSVNIIIDDAHRCGDAQPSLLVLGSVGRIRSVGGQNVAGGDEADRAIFIVDERQLR